MLKTLVTLATLGALAAAQTRPGARFHLEEASVADIQRALLAKQITTEQLVELYLKRIRTYNGTCVREPEGILGPVTTIAHARQVNALSTLNLRPTARKRFGFDDRKARSLTDASDGRPEMPDALEVAVAQDRELQRTGKLVGPLHGVVMAIKDQYDTFDMRTTSGADVDYANDRPPADATFVKRLREAGAIILAKANLAEYAVDGARSSFGGTFCNPYDTEREPGMSSAGSAASVAANLVTCAIGEETVVSIRWPSSLNSLVGLAPTEELVSRHGMMGSGLNMRTGPICRNVADAARVLDVIAGYDPKDDQTVFNIGRKPSEPYFNSAAARDLKGLRIGVLREYMLPLSKADEQSLALAERAIEDVRKLGATVVDPGPGKELFSQCLGQRSLRTLTSPAVEGEGKFMLNQYLEQRGDANIKSNADLISKARFYVDPNFPDRKQAREQAERATRYDDSAKLRARFENQKLLLNCMEQQHLDALMSPMSTVPPRKLTNPREPTVNGRSAIGYSFIGQQGFPAITVPMGFTTEVWDRVRDGNSTKLIGPVPVAIPVSIDFIARPFEEPLLFRIGSAYESATHHRRPPPEFGPIMDEP
jgi:Asp-tRNA(Asn)/Glu-tRNA(Gln) amidotransferase A subunit family amidase